MMYSSMKKGPHQFFFMVIFIFLSSSHKVISSDCSLDFNQFQYEARGECFDTGEASHIDSCCDSALMPVFQAMATRANLSKPIFLNPTQAKDCSDKFQDIHNRTDLSNCRIQDLISSSHPTTNPCSGDVGSIINLLGIEKYEVLRSSCRALVQSSYSDDACSSCVESYRSSLKALIEALIEVATADGGKRNGNDSNGRVCAEALLVTLASSDVGSVTWVQEIFSCLWDEIKLPWPPQKHEKVSLSQSKKLLATILVTVLLVILALILYIITKRRLQDSSKKEIENLSVLKNALDDDSTCQYSCFGLYIFSETEIARATNCFDSSNLIGVGSLGKVYLGIMPSGMRVAVKRMNEGMKLHCFLVEISKMAKIRHPNLVSILGYCSRGEQCLVYEYCVNGSLAKWLIPGNDVPVVLSWEQRVQIASGVARGLWFLQNNPLQKIIHGNVNLTNIQLNERLEAKILNLGLSNGSESKSKNGLRMEATDDVFGFGIVLLQLLTGKKLIDMNDTTSWHLLNEAKNKVSKGENVCELEDPDLNGAYDAAAFQRLFSIAVLCTTESQKERPNIQQILNKFQELQPLNRRRNRLSSNGNIINDLNEGVEDW